ncbi:thioredoxin fold domain-containing protein [Xanthobacter oligotrophicus]|uniref:thioredoxin fold domain-containing protein n=1 Tax=Xanthobacter oligotrophicus TaxID=2607286 RepID=UPI0011F302C9|nr:thioredoxin fold domain-containing protein [Xanthobacter oligotrophicus]MCG5236390.1 thioredoxin fold domain-containing protein [Xanthobacter oligotrophicus]
MRRALSLLALMGVLAVVLGAAVPARASELVMFERKGCVYCLQFDRDVAPIYQKTEEGRRAPLRRVDLSGGVPADVALARPVRFTPTFVLVDEGREVGRITGYASDEAFWGLLGALTQQGAPKRP